MTYLYNHKVVLNESEISKPSTENHTMGYSLSQYIHKKLNISKTLKELKFFDTVEVHGIYPDLEKFKELNPYLSDFKLLWQSTFKKDNSNSLRPIFFSAKYKDVINLYCLTTPGKDLLIHYTSLLKTFILSQNLNESLKVTAYLYPDAEVSIADWTDLNEGLIYPQDTVILGYSTFTKTLLKNIFPIVSSTNTTFYTSTRFQLPNGEILNSLEANYGHWGNISYYLSKKICELGAKEIIHIGKVGTLKDPTDIYKKVIVPSHFIIARQDSITRKLKISNNLADTYVTTGGHVAVSTTLEETHTQRIILEKENIESIDIESSKIGLAIEDYNISYQKNVKFGSIHFVSDYLRKEKELEIHLPIDLTSNKSQELNQKKKDILSKIVLIVVDHLLRVGSYSVQNINIGL